eukprot:11211265-Lingulodinium_polyedra.AAC.1
MKKRCPATPASNSTPLARRLSTWLAVQSRATLRARRSNTAAGASLLTNVLTFLLIGFACCVGAAWVLGWRW